MSQNIGVEAAVIVAAINCGTNIEPAAYLSLSEAMSKLRKVVGEVSSTDGGTCRINREE